MKKNILLLLMLAAGMSHAQQETIINYDLSKHRTDKPIPFAKPIVLVVNKLDPARVTRIDAYQMTVENGFRTPVTNKIGEMVRDLILEKTNSTDVLEIKIPALAANERFDIFILLKLTEKSKKSLLAVNNGLVNNPVDVAGNQALYAAFQKEALDPSGSSSGVSLNFTQYSAFFSAMLSPVFLQSINPASYQQSTALTKDEIKAIAKGSVAGISPVEDSFLLMEISNTSQWPAIQLGLADAMKISQPGFTPNAPHESIDRMANLESNLKYFYKIRDKLDKLIAADVGSIAISGAAVNLATVRTNVNAICQSIYQNKKLLTGYLDHFNTNVDSNQNLSDLLRLSGDSMLSSNLETQGKSILFLDTGLSYIGIEDIDNKMVYIPKLYLGVTLYFKPYDKNSRDSDFPRRSSLQPPRNRQAPGPDYDMIQRWSIWQHLALNIGATLGSYKNHKNFDNSVSGASLLIGPAYRFYKGFKISTGVAFVNRTSRNPLISEKKLAAGGYVSASVDIDFISHIQKFIDKL